MRHQSITVTNARTAAKCTLRTGDSGRFLRMVQDMAIHFQRPSEFAAATAGHLNDGAGLVLRIEGDQGRWWFRYTSPAGQRRAMSVGPAFIRGDAKLIEQYLRNAREVASEARSQFVVAAIRSACGTPVRRGHMGGLGEENGAKKRTHDARAISARISRGLYRKESHRAAR